MEHVSIFLNIVINHSKSILKSAGVKIEIDLDNVPLITPHILIIDMVHTSAVPGVTHS